MHWADWRRILAGRSHVSKRLKHPVVPYELGPGEVVSRFITSGRSMSVQHKRPKWGAFDPWPYDELSVVHSTGLPEPDVWTIGKLTLRDAPGRRTIYGRADVPLNTLITRKLRAIRNDKPFERHSSVVGWPHSTDADEMKQLYKSICLEISQDPDVKLLIPENPVSL
jgi:hypothetical protein